MDHRIVVSPDALTPSREVALAAAKRIRAEFEIVVKNYCTDGMLIGTPMVSIPPADVFAVVNYIINDLGKARK